MTAPFYDVPEEVRAFWSGGGSLLERLDAVRSHPMNRKCIQCEKTFIPHVQAQFFNDSGRTIHLDGGTLNLFGNHWNELVKHWDRRHVDRWIPTHQFVFGMWIDMIVSWSGGKFCSQTCQADFLNGDEA